MNEGEFRVEAAVEAAAVYIRAHAQNVKGETHHRQDGEESTEADYDEPAPSFAQDGWDNGAPC